MIIQDGADPLSDAGLRDESAVILAQSNVLRVLHHELARYCKGQIQGRSFLIAGHRGSGKTMLVADALRASMTAELETGMLRPLPVFLHGPSLLRTLPSDLVRNQLSLVNEEGAASPGARTSTQINLGAHGASGDDANLNIQMGAAPLAAVNPPNLAPAAPAANRNNGSQPKPAANDDEDPDFTVAQEKRVQLGLVHIILSLHRAVAKEFSRRYRDAVLNRAPIDPESAELAARFEIELLEDPTASRLRDYWDLAGALDKGVLREKGEVHATDQGARELVALNGICNAHQRISGALSKTTNAADSLNKTGERTAGFDAKAVDAFKPLGAILAGAFVAAGGAIGSKELLIPGLMGVVVAWASSMVLKSSVTTTETRKRSVDETFIPDLTPRTLDRVLPTLLDRLRAAGLAPVLVIDELDKVDDLPDRIDRLVSYLKKLVAENVFSCFLTDRSYLEFLRAARGGEQYARVSSYFTHRLMVSYLPRELDSYLDRLIPLAKTTNQPSSSLQNPEEIDHAVLKWVLRHRSQLHALSLQREVAALRGENNVVDIPAGAIRSDYQNLIDLTMQVAIEITLYSKEVMGWCQRQPFIQPTMFDALYYLSRSWLAGDETVDLSEAGSEELIKTLIGNMNLRDLAVNAKVASGVSLCELNDDDKKLLGNIVARIAHLLSSETTRDAVESQWDEIVNRLNWGTKSRLPQEVLYALLVGPNSLLVREAKESKRSRKKGPARIPEFIYRWRYWRSATAKYGLEPKLSELSEDDAKGLRRTLGYFDRCAATLSDELDNEANPRIRDVFILLSDGLRAIVTTPAWTQVEVAIVNLEQILDGSGDRLSLQRDLRTVRDFEQILRNGTPLVATLLFSAAILSGMSSDSTKLPLKDCAALLALGLRFASSKPVDSLRNVTAIFELLAEMCPEEDRKRLLALLDPKDLDLGDPNLSIDIEDCIAIGSAARFDWQHEESEAWYSLQQRLSGRETQDVRVPASLSELLCAMRRVGPAQWLPLDVDVINLAAWTRMLLQIRRGPARNSGPNYVPPFMAIFALFGLGGRRISRDAGEKILKVEGLADVDVDGMYQSMRSVTQLVAATPRAALVVRKHRDSVTDNWRAEPSLGLVAVVDNVGDLAEAFTLAEMVSPDRPVRILYEDAPAEGSDLESEVKSFASGGKLKVQLAYIQSPAAAPPAGVPVIFNPTDSDAVFRRLRLLDITPKP